MTGISFKQFLPILFITICSLLCFFPVNTVKGAVVNNTALLSKPTTVKQEKRIKRITKKLEAMPSKTKGILSLVAGVLAIAAVFLSIVMSFALSVPGVIVGIVLATILGTASIILGIQAIKEDAGGKGLGIAGVIFGGLGVLMLIGLTIGNLFF